ncbi:uncharacterized protein LOC131564315 [Ammospiza caudacuta]|uniref:uncharacterized protein LOC131564315 n=1 Tax=Ammospiza caudacuta TaxID=2857398 RepID=UPI002738CF8A|nr:uncharacterized protein LOC131564315 [Ammospiza caudacuta]
MTPTPPQTFTTLIIGLTIVLPQGSAPIDPWSHAHQCIHPELGTRGPYFEVYALRNNQPYASEVWDQPSMVAYKGDQVQIGCRELDPEEGKTRRLVLTIKPLMPAFKHNLITFSPVKMGRPTVWIQQKGPISCQWSDFREDPPGSRQPIKGVIYREDSLGELRPQNITYDPHPLLHSPGEIVISSGPEGGKALCEMAFRLDQSMMFTCERELKTLGQDISSLGRALGRAVDYRIQLPEDVIPLYPDLDLPQETTLPVECKAVHNLTFIGPQVIRKSNELKLLLDPTYSLKKVQMNIHTDITYLQKDCRPFIQQSLKGWNAWLATRSHHRKTKRDLSGWIGTGFGIVNTIDQEVLVNKLSTVTSSLGKLKVPLSTSMLTLAETQSLVVKLLTMVANHTAEDFVKLANYTGELGKDIALAIQCSQTQQWVQSVAAGIMREGTAGILPQEIRETILKDNHTTRFERDHQAWWQLVNFTYEPQREHVEAYVLTISAAEERGIFPILTLGTMHQDVIVRPINHNVWASYDYTKNKWQSVSTEACIPRGQLGYVCENAVVEAEDLCLDAENSVCTLEMLPHDKTQSQVYYIGNGCACVRTACDNVTIDNCLAETNNTNFCACNFTKIIGCDFHYTVPITTQQLINANFNLYQEIPKLQIGMDVKILKAMLAHPEVKKLVQKVNQTTKRMVWQIEHDSERIKNVLTEVEQVGQHHWWDIFTGYSPTATQVFHYLVHPMLVVIIALLLLTLTNICLWWRLRGIMKRTQMIWAMARAYQCPVRPELDERIRKL